MLISIPSEWSRSDTANLTRLTQLSVVQGTACGHHISPPQARQSQSTCARSVWDGLSYALIGWSAELIVHSAAEKSIPIEFKVSYPRGHFRNFNKFIHGSQRPSFLGERLRAPAWWKQTEVISAFDKVMHDKVRGLSPSGSSADCLQQHKRPSLIQRLTKTGMARYNAQLTVGEQLAKTMMRRRACEFGYRRIVMDRFG